MPTEDTPARLFDPANLQWDREIPAAAPQFDPEGWSAFVLNGALVLCYPELWVPLELAIGLQILEPDEDAQLNHRLLLPSGEIWVEEAGDGVFFTGITVAAGSYAVTVHSEPDRPSFTVSLDPQP